MVNPRLSKAKARGLFFQMVEELRASFDPNEPWSYKTFRFDYESLPDDWKHLLIEEYVSLGGTLDIDGGAEDEGPMGSDQESIRIK